MKKIYLFILIFMLSALPAQAFTVSHQFKVLLGPFNASSTIFNYTLSPAEYSVNSVVRTAGVFDTLYPFKANYATTGKIEGQELITTAYHYDSKSRFNKRTKEMVYDDNGTPLYRISTKNDKEKKVSIEPDVNNRDTTDLQTVFAELSRQYNQVHFCASRMQVFDGKRRFDVIFKDEGEEELPLVEHTTIAGKTSKCSMYIDKLGTQGDDLLWELTQDRPIYFWIMKDPNYHKPFIARIMIEETPLGRLDVYTTTVKITE